MAFLRCPKCSNVVDFEDGRIFGYCNKCGSRLTRDAGDCVSVFNLSEFDDENVQFIAERFNICTDLKLPNRSNHDFESFNFEVERILDELMTFCECSKDFLSEIPNYPEDRRYLVCEICGDMADKLYKQFGDFLYEYRDSGLYDEYKALTADYGSMRSSLSASFSQKQRENQSKLWEGREQEREELKRQLEDAKLRKKKIPLFNLKANWEADNEIAELERKLSGKS